jgi:peptidyl-prolyl cis-trans isomerase C
VIPGRVPAFEEIESDVKTAWLGEQKAVAWEKAYKEMRAKYTVLLPAPPDAQQGPRAATTPRKKQIPASSGEGAE